MRCMPAGLCGTHIRLDLANRSTTQPRRGPPQPKRYEMQWFLMQELADYGLRSSVLRGRDIHHSAECFTEEKPFKSGPRQAILPAWPKWPRPLAMPTGWNC